MSGRQANNAGTDEGPQRPRQNRVTPFGEFLAVAEKGTMLGNRGDIHDSAGSLGKRRWATKAWICCTLDERHGRKINFDRRGSYYPLFFVDEATALAAGHRPCGECRHGALALFKQAWAKTKGLPPATFIGVSDIDAELHRARLDTSFPIQSRQVRFGDLPDGAMFQLLENPGIAMLAREGCGLAWRFSGYQPRHAIKPDRQVIAITPQPLIEVMRAGYRPLVHPSAVQGSATKS